MPGKIIEKYWDRAKARAAEQGHTEDWPYVMAIYKSMTKNKKKSAFLETLQKTAKYNRAVFYHGSPKQGLKEFDPTRARTSHTKKVEDRVYATDDAAFAAGFCFPWDDKMGITLSRKKGERWVLSIPKEHEALLEESCSMYQVEAEPFRKVSVNTPEFVAKKKVKVVNETKFKSARECLEKYGVEIKIKKSAALTDALSLLSKEKPSESALLAALTKPLHI